MKYNKYIFLNVNNTICIDANCNHTQEFVSTTDSRFNEYSKYLRNMIMVKLNLLRSIKTLVEENNVNLKIILLSPPRDFKIMQSVYEYIRLPLHDKCNTLKISKYDMYSTGLGVLMYCKKYNISPDDYVIIDSKDDYLYSQRNNLYITEKNYRTEEHKGLTQEQAESVLKFFIKNGIEFQKIIMKCSIDEVFKYLDSSNTKFKTYKVPKNSDKYSLFLQDNGLVCVKCGKKVNAVYLHRNFDAKNFNVSYFFNFYYEQEDGMNVHLFTKDHIIPKSKGGKDHISNYQTMCEDCNREKGNKDER